MKPKDTLIINLDVNWRVLVVLGVVSILTFTYFAVAAQGGDPPTTNSVQTEATANPSEQIFTLPGLPELQCADGFLPTTNGECVPVATIGVAPLSATGAAGITAVGGGSRHFYLTDANYATNAAKTACASGYHMASLWEILDVSNLTYDYNHPAAHTKADSGYGPPSAWNGWVRTGFSSSGSSTTGTGNCLNWTSVSASDYGVSVKLSNAWETAPGDISAWDATSFPCNSIGPVWCVGDFYTLYLPLVLKGY